MDPQTVDEDLRLVRKSYLLKYVLPVSKATFNRWLATGRFPSGVLLSDRIRVWSLQEVKQWLASNLSGEG
ncbi:helix-turn-helix transcriptional regulator [Roseateles sp.]|uniref:AlpA family transcriptional regulator n=1 Tax=Roseateles puraquae TaxID=431059 RepID=A0A254N637_9BURK|nr:AlpA family phage regulatory protein [Roseateles puraquae]OWQ96470.1 AlpA family transcriptional regulator [Roseateles puraquae]RTL22486.1 MAG: AlpA family phage regulatory protein [Burkholderiales bacterium]